LISRGPEDAVPVGHCVVFDMDRGSGSCGLSHSLLDLGSSLTRPSRYSRGPGSRPAVPHDSRRGFRPIGKAPRDLSPLLQSARLSVRAPRDLRGDLEPVLSWDSPACRPPAVRRSARPLPEAEASFGPTVPPVGVSFRPRGFSPPRRLAPRRRCGSVAPRCRLWGSTRFVLGASIATRRWTWHPRHSPRRGSYPSKSSPRQQPCRITATVALLPLPPAPVSFQPAEAGLPLTGAVVEVSWRAGALRPHVTGGVGSFDGTRCQMLPSAPLP